MKNTFFIISTILSTGVWLSVTGYALLTPSSELFAKSSELIKVTIAIVSIGLLIDVTRYLIHKYKEQE